jgi:hypothetical protein
LFFYGALELFPQWVIICCSIVLWNSSDSVSIISFSMGLWNYSHSVALSVYLLDIELIRECDIIWFSMGLWNYSDSVPLFVTNNAIFSEQLQSHIEK